MDEDIAKLSLDEKVERAKDAIDYVFDARASDSEVRMRLQELIDYCRKCQQPLGNAEQGSLHTRKRRIR